MPITRAGIMKTDILKKDDRQCYGSIYRHHKREVDDPVYAAKYQKEQEEFWALEEARDEERQRRWRELVG